MDDVIRLVSAVSKKLALDPRELTERENYFKNGCFDALRELWTHNGLRYKEEMVLRDYGYSPYDPRFPAQPMTFAEAHLWQLACYGCPANEEGLLPPGEDVLSEFRVNGPRIAGSLLACRACRTWQGRLLECVACGRILI
jgi:hypothetical protein